MKKDDDVKEVDVRAGSKRIIRKGSGGQKSASKPQGRERRVLRPNKIRMRQERKRRVVRRDEDEGLEKKIVSIRRVSRVYSGGKRLRMSVFAVVGDKKGHVGVGLGKGFDVRSAAEKAYKFAKDRMITVQLKGNTIPHGVTHKKGAAKVMLKPAAPGTGVIAGGAVRAVVETAGIKDVLSKVLGTNNQISNVYCTLEALKRLRVTRIGGA